MVWDFDWRQIVAELITYGGSEGIRTQRLLSDRRKNTALSQALDSFDQVLFGAAPSNSGRLRCSEQFASYLLALAQKITHGKTWFCGFSGG